VKFDKVTPAKPMSFSSLNGDIDVTFPPDIKARLKLKSEQGDIYSDFDIQMQPGSRQPVVEENRQKSGKYPRGEAGTPGARADGGELDAQLDRRAAWRWARLRRLAGPAGFPAG
jgi:hypothetical protein